MRRVLSFLGARGVITTGLVVLVLAVVGVAKLASGPPDRNGANPGEVQSETYLNPSEGDDGVSATTPPSVVDDPAARAVATDFTTNWLKTDRTAQAWHAALADDATPALAETLQGVDPAGVPATRLTGTAKITLHAEAYAEVALPADSGMVRLSLVQRDGRWLVDGIDWEPV